MVSEACCNSDRTQAVFPDPVIPAIMEVKGCSKRNRWHFCENIGTVWNGVRPALRCLDITCLCILSFLLKDFSQTEQNQLMSAQEQIVDWERGRMLRIYIGFQAIKFYCFPPPPPSSSSTTTTTTATTANTTFLLFSIQHHHHISIVFPPPPPAPPPPPPHFYCFPPPPAHFLCFLLPPPPPPPHFYYFPSTTTRFYTRPPTAIISSFCSNVSCSKQQSWFSSIFSWLLLFISASFF